MKIDCFKAADIRKAIFLILFLVFLFFGLEVFAVAECNFDGWDKDDCAVDIHYTDPSGGSGLDKCEWKAGSTSAMPSNCSDVINWDSACDCKDQTDTICSVTILIGSAGDCNVNGTGACKICFKATDNAGNTAYASASLSIDFAIPTTTIQCNGEDCKPEADWYNADVTVTLDCYDCASPGVDCSGCDKIYYCVDQTGSCDPDPAVDGIEYTGAFTLTTEGTNYVTYYSIDIAGNSETTKSQTVKIDKTKPVSEIASPPADSEQNADFDISVTDTDTGGSGIDTDACYYYVFDSVEGQTRVSTLRTCNSTQNITVSPTGDCRTIGGTCTVYVYSYDLASNPSDTNFRSFQIVSADVTPPTVTVEGAPADWQNTDAQAVVACDDGGGGGTPTYETPQSAVASSEYSSTYPASNARDGNTATYWFSQSGSPPQWIYFDLGTKKYVSGINVMIYNIDVPMTMDIQVSDDASSWTTVVSSWTVSTGNTWAEKSFTETAARYIRLYETAFARTYGQCTEFQALTRPFEGGSGCDPTTYKLKTYTSSGSCSTNYSDYTLTSPQTISSHLWVCAAAKDLAGNEGFSPIRVEFKVDKEDPMVTSFTADRTLLDITNPTVTFSWAATDSGGSHLKQAELWRRIVGESWSANPIDTLASSGDSDSGIFIDSPTADGDYEYGLRALDNADNWGAEPATIIITVDKTVPTTTISPDGKDWGNSDVDFTLSCDDGTGSGCQTTEYKIIDQSQTCDTAGLITGTSGTVTCPEGQTCQKKVCFRSIDNLNNEETINTSNLFKIDKESPLVGAISPTVCQVNVSTSFSANVSDNIEVTNCWLYICGGEYGEFPGTNNGEMDSSLPCPNCTVSKSHLFTAVGDYDLYAYCIDEASNPGAGTPVTVEVTEFGPLICDINVPGTGIINQWIEINVFGSQGAIVEVHFASNLIGDPTGSWTNWYDWDIPSGDWEDASSKIMKWSFAETGNYEVWTELKDGAGDTQACYDTILIMECYPGQEDTCTSDPWGCTHTIRCTPQGTWPSCPEDECIRFTENDPNCPCSGIDVCVGSDYYDYPEYGSTVIGFGNCNDSCICNVGMALDQPCAPIIYPFDPHCTYCGDGHCDSGETVWNCCPDCGIPEPGCDYNLRYWYICDNHNPTKHTEDCGSDSWTENYQCSGDILQREYCERGCSETPEVHCYENCYPVDWQDCNDLDGCVGPDYYDYSCSGAACVLSDIIEDYSECMGIVCGDDNCDGPLETVWTCCQDCEPLPPPGCDFNTRYYYTCPTPPGTIPQKNTEDCGSDSWTENYQCSADNRYVQREYCERGCQDASCYENCYPVDWQDCDSWDGCVDADYHDYSCLGAACVAEILPGDYRCAHGDGGHDQCNTNTDCNDGNPCTHNWCERPEDPDSICHSDNVDEGTSCGICKECDGSGNCVNRLEGYDTDECGLGCQRCVFGSCQDYSLACDNTTSSCECITDECIDCSNYYDPGGPTPGYGFCEDWQTPVWNCIEGKCQYDCEGVPPPGCTRKNPEVYIYPDAPWYGEGNPGDPIKYTVEVWNKDAGEDCEDSTFSLSTGEYCDETDWSCSELPDLIIPPNNQHDSTTLTVTSPFDVPSGNYDISVRAYDSVLNRSGFGYATYEVPNQPPEKPTPSPEYPGGVSWNHCSVKALSIPTFHWIYSDPEGDPPTAYEIIIKNLSNLTKDEWRASGGSGTSYSPSSPSDDGYIWRNWMDWNTDHEWKVRVRDNHNNWSDWSDSTSFTTPIHAAPWPKFEPSPTRVHLNEVVTFEDSSACYIVPNNSKVSCDFPGSSVSYEWDFDYNIETEEFTVDSNTQGSTTKKYIKLGKYYVKLRITDTVWPTGETVTCDSDPEEVVVTLPLPEWWEIAPF